MRRTIALLSLFVTIGPILAAEPMRFEYEEPHMGTKFRIVLYANDRSTADLAARAAFARVAQLNQIMSDYQADSELMVLCKKTEHGPSGPVPVSDELLTVLARAREVAELSEGAFDPSIGPVVRLWRQARKDRRLPDEEARAEALRRVGYRHIVVDPRAKTIELKTKGMQLDLGGIAKGYAADECLKVLEKHGITSALVAASGDIAVSSPPPGKAGWRIDIAPLPGSREQRQLLLKNMAVSTSGDSEQFVEIAGTRYSHVVDPRTGLGLTGRRSVTVVAPRGIDADSLTKMASILEPEKALAAIARVPGTETLIVVSGKEVKQSKGFDAFVAKE